MRFSQKCSRFFLMVSVFLLAFLTAYFAGHFLTQPEPTFRTHGTIFAPLHIEVAPKGYPIVGQSWTIFVYQTVITSDKTTFKVFANSSVVVTVQCENHPRTYNLSANEGQATFTYLPEYQDVAFQAFSGDLASQKVVISEHYISSVVVDQLSGGNLIALAVTVGGWFFSRNKIGKKSKFLIIAIICLFGLISIISLLSKFFQETVWGYPERIIGQVVTFTLLKYITVIGFGLLVMFIGYALFSSRKKIA